MRSTHALEKTIAHYLDCVIAPELQQKRQMKSFAAYALGLLGDGDRKSCEPIAARSASGMDEADRVKRAGQGHDRLLHFLGNSPWNDEAVRLAAARYAIEEIEKYQPVTDWIIDDTGFPKQGKHSVGVQRQYSGTLGKTGNCQVGVSLSIATNGEHLPIDFELYLPLGWIDNQARRDAVGIPKDAVFKTKLELAVDMIRRAKRHGIPGDTVLADSGYGHSRKFRAAIRDVGMDYAVAVQSSLRVWLLDFKNTRLGDKPTRVDQLATLLGPAAFRQVTWRDGTKKEMSSNFCFRRVKVEQDDGLTADDREAVWLVIESSEDGAMKYMLTTLPRRLSKRQIVGTLRQRWRTEQAYQEMKEELGLDHFEGRSFRGWHHHVSVVLSCYAFVVAERRRRFPPSAAEAATGEVNHAA